MFGTNGTLYEKREDGKLVELFSQEADLFKAGTLRQHRQPPCRFQDCQQEWYLSEGKLAWHQRKQASEEGWKLPTSCPMHRDISKIRYIASTTDLCEKTGKRTFKSKSEAEVFAAARTANNGASLQHAYECDACGGFHLSSMNPEQQDALEQAKAAGSPSTVISQAALETVPLDKETQVCRMYQSGARVVEIADKLHVSQPTIYTYLKKNNVAMRSSAGRRPDSPAKSTIKPTTIAGPVESIDSIDALIEQLQHKRKLLEDAKRLRVEPVGTNAFIIIKEGERATLPLTELQPLIQLLTTFVPQQSAA